MTGAGRLRIRWLAALLAAALLAAALLRGVGTAAAPEAAAPSVSAEEAADFARRAALSALHGPQKIFLESIDADGILRRLLGSPVWGGLTRRQQEILRTTVRDHFAEAFAGISGAASEVRWAWVPPGAESPVPVSMGLHYGNAMLKTRWIVARTPRGWSVQDVILLDPGLSLSQEVGRLLGPHPVSRRDRAREARNRVLPRLVGLLAVVGIAVAFSRRLPPDRRRLLWLTAAVPAILFAIDGGLAARRALSETFALVESLPPQRWREFEKTALDRQRAGDAEAARAAWEQAVEAGAPRGPVSYQMGVSARSSGDTVEAARDFETALSDRPPAPGAAKELALIALAEGRYADARTQLENYLRATGPDPDSLATLAVIRTNVGDTAGAVQAIESARALVGESWKKAELEAQVYARAGDAAATVAALRPLEGQGRLDRSALRADPAFLTIATDPAWIAFLEEPPSVASSAATPTPAVSR